MISMFVATLAISMPCSAQSPGVIARDLYDQLDQSRVNHDLDQVLSFVDAAAYVDIDAKGNRRAFGEYRKELAQSLSQTRNISPITIVKDVQLEGDRMVVDRWSEAHFEYYEQRLGWTPEIYTSSAEDTWERMGGEWKIVMSQTLRDDTRVDPDWEAEQAKDEAEALAARLTDPPADTN
jgi:hypothetical protein